MDFAFMVGSPSTPISLRLFGIQIASSGGSPFPKKTFLLSPEAEHRWGPYPTERNAAETLVAFRYQRRIERI
jgi:hypothetical protein